MSDDEERTYKIMILFLLFCIISLMYSGCQRFKELQDVNIESEIAGEYCRNLDPEDWKSDFVWEDCYREAKENVLRKFRELYICKRLNNENWDYKDWEDCYTNIYSDLDDCYEALETCADKLKNN